MYPHHFLRAIDCGRWPQEIQLLRYEELLVTFPPWLFPQPTWWGAHYKQTVAILQKYGAASKQYPLPFLSPQYHNTHTHTHKWIPRTTRHPLPYILAVRTTVSSAFIFSLSSLGRQFNQVCGRIPKPSSWPLPFHSPLFLNLCMSEPASNTAPIRCFSFSFVQSEMSLS